MDERYREFRGYEPTVEERKLWTLAFEGDMEAARAARAIGRRRGLTGVLVLFTPDGSESDYLKPEWKCRSVDNPYCGGCDSCLLMQYGHARIPLIDYQKTAWSDE